MAAALGSAHLCGAPAAASAGAPAVASAKSPLVKPSEARGTPDSRSQPSRDFHPPPPKKVRVEERGIKTKKLIRDGGVGSNGSVKEKVQQPAKSCSSGPGSWNVSPEKTSSSSNNPSVPATGGSQPPSNTHKLFKQSEFFLHKAPSSSSKPKKANKDKQREKEREKVKGDGMEKKKYKVAVTPGPGSNASNSTDFSKCDNSSAVKRANGEVTARPSGKPPLCVICLKTVVVSKVELWRHFCHFHPRWVTFHVAEESSCLPPPPLSPHLLCFRTGKCVAKRRRGTRTLSGSRSHSQAKLVRARLHRVWWP